MFLEVRLRIEVDDNLSTRRDNVKKENRKTK